MRLVLLGRQFFKWTISRLCLDQEFVREKGMEMEKIGDPMVPSIFIHFPSPNP